MTGLFLAFEGGEGAGKTTQAALLAGWLCEVGREVVLTREPGGTPLGARVRDIVLDVASAGLAPRAEALLYAADRAHHVATVVRPALERGAVVLTDRYSDSSVAYQGAGRVLSAEDVAWISTWATEGLRPALTVLLDVDPQVGLRRFNEPADRLESEPLEFHHRVRQRFLDLAAAAPERYLVLPASDPAEALAARIRAAVEPLTGAGGVTPAGVAPATPPEVGA